MIANKRTLAAKGSAVAESPNERAVTFRLTTSHYAKLKELAIKNYRTMSQECALRVMASIEAEEAK